MLNKVKLTVNFPCEEITMSKEMDCFYCKGWWHNCDGEKCQFFDDIKNKLSEIAAGNNAKVAGRFMHIDEKIGPDEHPDKNGRAMIEIEDNNALDNLKLYKQAIDSAHCDRLRWL